MTSRPQHSFANMAPPAHMVLDPVDDIFLRDDLGPTISEHALQCSHLFKKHMALPGIVQDPTLMDDQLARFTLWASNMDVFGPPNISLDYRLRYSSTVVEIIHQLLDVICSSLTSLKPIDGPTQTSSRKKRRISGMGNAEFIGRINDDSSDTDSDEDQAQRNISLITYTIGGTVTRLFRLSNAIRKSAKASRTYKIGEYKDDEEANNAITELRLYTECYIRFRFPQAPQALCSTLVEANALRLRRLYYQRSHRRRVALSVQRPQAEPLNVQLPKMLDSTPTVRFGPSVPLKPKLVDTKPKTTSFPPAPVTYASTARQTAVKALYADSTVDVPRAKSVIVNNKLSFPPLPITSECPYCGVVVEPRGATKSIVWNDHVIRDLEPFVCIFPHCMESSQKESGLLTFETSKAWMNHMQNAHGYAWECRAPSHEPIIFGQESEFQEHSCTEHSVPVAHVGTLSSAARRPVLEKIRECPFGDDFLAPEETESNTVFSHEALHLHVATHMKEIALLALQKLPSDGDDKSEDVDSDIPLEDNGPAKLRGSMYSVLDDEALDFSDKPEDGDSMALDLPPEEGIGTSIDRLNLEDKDAAGRTKLHRAVRDNDLALVESLAKRGADLRARDDYGKTALHYASMGGDRGTDIMKFLLDSDAKGIVDLKDKHGQTPLHHAAGIHFVDGIRLLVNRGGTIDLSDNYGLSPCIWSIISGESDAVRQLLSFGADVNSTSADGKSALSWAVSMGHSSIAELLVEQGALVGLETYNTRSVPLGEAAAYGRHSTIQPLLDLGADPNHRDRDGWSAIHWAAEEGHLLVVSLLLDRGANVNAVSSYGTTPLHCAANAGHHRIAEMLIERGADPVKSTCHGWSPLHHAAFMGHYDTVQVLLENNTWEKMGSLQDNHGWSVLHLAVHGRHFRIVTLLLSFFTPEVRHYRDESGLTAEEWLEFEFDSHSFKSISNLAFSKSRCCRAVTTLRQAARDNNIVMVKLLLERGFVVDDMNSGRRTALYHAATKGHIPIMDMLLEKGADPNILPAGRKTWEEFISDNAILQRLRQAGYKKPITDPDEFNRFRQLINPGAVSIPSFQTQMKQPTSTAGPSRIDNNRSYANRRDTPEKLGTPSDPAPASRKENDPGGKTNESRSRSRVSKLWKRLRGQ